MKLGQQALLGTVVVLQLLLASQAAMEESGMGATSQAGRKRRLLQAAPPPDSLNAPTLPQNTAPPPDAPSPPAQNCLFSDDYNKVPNTAVAGPTFATWKAEPALCFEYCNLHCDCAGFVVSGHVDTTTDTRICWFRSQISWASTGANYDVNNGVGQRDSYIRRLDWNIQERHEAFVDVKPGACRTIQVSGDVKLSFLVNLTVTAHTQCSPELVTVGSHPGPVAVEDTLEDQNSTCLPAPYPELSYDKRGPLYSAAEVQTYYKTVQLHPLDCVETRRVLYINNKCKQALTIAITLTQQSGTSCNVLTDFVHSASKGLSQTSVAAIVVIVLVVLFVGGCVAAGMFFGFGYHKGGRYAASTASSDTDEPQPTPKLHGRFLLPNTQNMKKSIASTRKTVERALQRAAPPAGPATERAGLLWGGQQRRPNAL